jgi:FkbM family methyltransferase
MFLLRQVRRRALEEVRSRGIQVKRMPATLIRHPEALLTVTLEELVGRLPAATGLFFVQIGAFDGRTNDPLHDLVVAHDWRGILVEPQERYFDQLRLTYASRRGLAMRNVAVGARNETRAFYHLDDEAPDWAYQLASFDPEIIVGHGRDQLRPHIVSDTVQCVTFESLLDEVDHVDVLQIDAEGYDAELIHLFDFDRWQPSIVQFEHVHLSHAGHDGALRILVSRGYRVAVLPEDTVAFRVA